MNHHYHWLWKCVWKKSCDGECRLEKIARTCLPWQVDKVIFCPFFDTLCSQPFLNGYYFTSYSFQSPKLVWVGSRDGGGGGMTIWKGNIKWEVMVGSGGDSNSSSSSNSRVMRMGKKWPGPQSLFFLFVVCFFSPCPAALVHGIGKNSEVLILTAWPFGFWNKVTMGVCDSKWFNAKEF